MEFHWIITLQQARRGRLIPPAQFAGTTVVGPADRRSAVYDRIYAACSARMRELAGVPEDAELITLFFDLAPERLT